MPATDDQDFWDKAFLNAISGAGGGAFQFAVALGQPSEGAPDEAGLTADRLVTFAGAVADRALAYRNQAAMTPARGAKA